METSNQPVMDRNLRNLLHDDLEKEELFAPSTHVLNSLHSHTSLLVRNVNCSEMVWCIRKAFNGHMSNPAVVLSPSATQLMSNSMNALVEYFSLLPALIDDSHFSEDEYDAVTAALVSNTQLKALRPILFNEKLDLMCTQEELVKRHEFVYGLFNFDELEEELEVPHPLTPSPKGDGEEASPLPLSKGEGKEASPLPLSKGEGKKPVTNEK